MERGVRTQDVLLSLPKAIRVDIGCRGSHEKTQLFDSTVCCAVGFAFTSRSFPDEFSI